MEKIAASALISINAIDINKLPLNKHVYFTEEITLCKGANKITIKTILNVLCQTVELAIRLFDKETNQDILRSFPKYCLGENIDLFVNVSDTKNARLTFTLKKTSNAIKNSLLPLPNIQINKFNRINDVVDKIFVISLKHRTDKQKEIIDQMEFLDIKFEFFQAVNGSEGQFYKDWIKYIKQKKMSTFENSIGRNEIYYAGAWGYNETFIKIISEAIKENLSSIAIFDDDICFHKDFLNLFNDISKDQDFNDKSLIYLGARIPNKNQTMPELITHDVEVTGSYAVIIKSKIFKDLLTVLLKKEHVVDGVPLTQFIKQKKSVILRDPLVIPKYKNGDIRPDRNDNEIYIEQNIDTNDFWLDAPSRSKYSKKKLYSDISSFTTSGFVILGVKSKNRLDYLMQLLNSFNATKNPNIRYKIYIADTSTEDNYIEIEKNICSIKFENTSVSLLRVHDGSVTDLTNAILSEIYKKDRELNPVIFIADDDLLFCEKGWDTEYVSAVVNTPYKHLVFFDRRWRSASQHLEKKVGDINLVSNASYTNAQGAFYTLTIDILDSVGFFNRDLFPTKGGAHLNYTFKIYEYLKLVTTQIFDLKNSNSLLALQSREGYIGTGSDQSIFHQLLLNSLDASRNFEKNITDLTVYKKISEEY